MKISLLMLVEIENHPPPNDPDAPGLSLHKVEPLARCPPHCLLGCPEKPTTSSRMFYPKNLWDLIAGGRDVTARG